MSNNGTAALSALETDGASEAGSALETVAASIDKVTLNQTLANKITFSLYWEKELTDLQMHGEANSVLLEILPKE
ncbi:hypothetical protein G9A89_011076 [Geosiphon pyriformis]|nr:hypothetical protein G9A89_011076 [Geosiphon pyriformis]